MNPIKIIEDAYRAADQPVAQLDSLIADLQHWYRTYPSNNYLQPCVIDGKAALVCQKQLSRLVPDAYRTLSLICQQYGINLKEDARAQIDHSDFADNRRKMAVVLTFCLAMASGAQAATVGGRALSTVSRVEPQTQSVSLAINNQTLSDVARKIASETGIQFKFDVAVENDLINKNLVAQDWNHALVQLLQRYNYTTIQEHHTIKTVLITGYKGGVKPVADTDERRPLDSDRVDPGDLFDNRVAVDIDIPTDLLANLPEGGEMTVDLPMGAFNVKQESMVATEDGSLSWEGMLEADNTVYQLYLTKTLDGEVVGNVYSPDDLYSIETVNGQLVLIEIDRRLDQISMR